MLWIAGRPAWHIGASGLVYGLASFVFVSGFIRRNIRMIAISLLVVFLYGGMIWHMFPIEINDPISWEGHLFGAIGGSISALYFSVITSYSIHYTKLYEVKRKKNRRVGSGCKS